MEDDKFSLTAHFHYPVTGDTYNFEYGSLTWEPSAQTQTEAREYIDAKMQSWLDQLIERLAEAGVFRPE